MNKVKLKDVCEAMASNIAQKDILVGSGDYPIYGASGFIGNVDFYKQERPYIGIVKDGAGVGRAYLLPEKSSVIGTMQYILPKDNIDIKYLYYAIQYMRLEKYYSGATIPHIYFRDYQYEPILLPDKKEQEQKTGVLEKIDKLIANHEKMVKVLDTLVKSRFVEMFGSPIANDKNLPIASLGSCLQGIENGKSFVCDSNSRTGKQPGVLKLSAATYGIYKPEENKAILSADDFVEQAEVHAGDLLFTRKNTPELVGMSAYVWQTPEKLMMPDLIFRLIPNQQMHPIFLWKLINHDVFRCKIQELATGTAKSMSNISKERLRNLEIIVPPIKLQNQFADFVVQTDKSKLAIQQSIETIQTLKAKLMQDYFG